MPANAPFPRPLKKVQIQDGTPQPGVPSAAGSRREIHPARGEPVEPRSEWRGGRGTRPQDGSPQVGLFQRPDYSAALGKRFESSSRSTGFPPTTCRSTISSTSFTATWPYQTPSG